jgi:hypothetical protein
VLPRLLEGEGNSGVRALVEAQGLVQISGERTPGPTPACRVQPGGPMLLCSPSTDHARMGSALLVEPQRLKLFVCNCERYKMHTCSGMHAR